MCGSRGQRDERKQVHERVFISGRERGLAGLHRTRFEWFSEYCKTFFVGTAGAVCEWCSNVGGCRRLSVGLR